MTDSVNSPEESAAYLKGISAGNNLIDFGVVHGIACLIESQARRIAELQEELRIEKLESQQIAAGRKAAMLMVERRNATIAKLSAEPSSDRVHQLQGACHALIGFAIEARNLIDQDKEVKALKLLTAVGGDCKGYRADIDAVREIVHDVTRNAVETGKCK